MKKHKRFLPPNYYVIYKRITSENSPVENLKRAYIDGSKTLYFEIGDKIFRTKSLYHSDDDKDASTLQDRVNNIISREVS